MTVTATVPTKVTALDILEQTRELFAKTHWTVGSLYWTEPGGKKRFCMVGGLCHIFAKNGLPDWLKDNPRQSFYVNALLTNEYKHEGLVADNVDVEVLIDAEWEMAKTIAPDLSSNVSPHNVEAIIIDWNDQVAADEFDARGDASYVLEIMDQTIERVKEQGYAKSPK